MKSEVIKLLEDVVKGEESLDGAKDALVDIGDDNDIEDILSELDFIEENFEDNINLMKESIKLLIDNIENENIDIIEKPSIREIEEAVESIDRDKLLLKNMVIMTIN